MNVGIHYHPISHPHDFIIVHISTRESYPQIGNMNMQTLFPLVSLIGTPIFLGEFYNYKFCHQISIFTQRTLVLLAIDLFNINKDRVELWTSKTWNRNCAQYFLKLKNVVQKCRLINIQTVFRVSSYSKYMLQSKHCWYYIHPHDWAISRTVLLRLLCDP